MGAVHRKVPEDSRSHFAVHPTSERRGIPKKSVMHQQKIRLAFGGLKQDGFASIYGGGDAGYIAIVL